MQTGPKKKNRVTNPKSRNSFPVEWGEKVMQHKFHLAIGTGVRMEIVLKSKFNNLSDVTNSPGLPSV
jgi:hypothetical protein